MDQETIRHILSGQKRGAGPCMLRAALWAASGPYGLAMLLRRWAYRRGILPSHAAEVPVVCVGNLTTGGTGKTPMVVWTIQRLREMGRQVVVLSRGYKAIEGRSDEAELLRELCGVEVVVQADRVAGAAEGATRGDVLVMDDGFQHRRLRRDLDIVLIDATNPFGYGHCLPRGLMREPPRALRDAAVVVITHSDEIDEPQVRQLRARLKGLSRSAVIAQAVHRPTHLIDAESRTVPLAALAGRKVCAFCGLANPDAFFTMLGNLHARVAARHALDDHAAYGPEVVEMLARSAGESESGLFVTTCKDYVKLKGDILGVPVWRLAVELDVVAGRDEVLARLKAAVEG